MIRLEAVPIWFSGMKNIGTGQKKNVTGSVLVYALHGEEGGGGKTTPFRKGEPVSQSLSEAVGNEVTASDRRESLRDLTSRTATNTPPLPSLLSPIRVKRAERKRQRDRESDRQRDGEMERQRQRDEETERQRH